MRHRERLGDATYEAEGTPEFIASTAQQWRDKVADLRRRELERRERQLVFELREVRRALLAMALTP